MFSQNRKKNITWIFDFTADTSIHTHSCSRTHKNGWCFKAKWRSRILVAFLANYVKSNRQLFVSWIVFTEVRQRVNWLNVCFCLFVHWVNIWTSVLCIICFLWQDKTKANWICEKRSYSSTSADLRHSMGLDIVPLYFFHLTPTMTMNLNNDIDNF